MQTAGFGDGFEQWEIYVEPVETVSLNVFVNHLIIHFTIVGTIQIDVETSVFIFVDIFEVGGIDKNLSALVEQSLETVEEGREVFYFPSNASAVHQEEDGIKACFQMFIEKIDAFRILYSSQFHRFAAQRRNINGFYLQALLLQGERMAAAAGSDIQYTPFCELQGLLLQHRHLLNFSEEMFHRHFVLFEHRGEHT